MSWYRRMVVAALLDGAEMDMFERWVDGIATGISAAKNKTGLNRMDPRVVQLDKWCFQVIQATKNIWTHFRAGRLDAAIESGNQVEKAMPTLAKLVDTSDIMQQLEMVTDTMKSVQISQNTKRKQQQQWSNGTPPAQPQLKNQQPQAAPQTIPQQPPAAAYG